MNRAAQRSLGSEYGDGAIGRVQLKRTKNTCSVVADMMPEHKIKMQPYKVVVNVDIRNLKMNAELAPCTKYWIKNVYEKICAVLEIK